MSGIFFIWDEFTDYLRHSDDQTVMQQISEFCKVQPLFMCFVVHKDSAWVDAIGNETYQHIADRFHSVEFHVSTDAAYNLIAGSITVRNGMMNNWLDTRSNVMRRIQPYKADLSSLDDKLSEQIEHLCPMHPMTIKLLSRVAENFAAAQRTMFRFMKDASNPGQGFVGYINKEGPDSQCCWLTPDWLWDYFFTRESDFHDKETKVPEYIRHYEENVTFVEKDEATHRVFKVAMLLLAMMSSVKGVYIGRRTNNGIAATVDCLELCLAGVMTKKEIEDKLEILESIKVLLRDEAPNGDIRLQMPYKASENDFDVRLAANDKKYTRYQMFAKEGTFSKAFEEQAWDQTDASFKRMRIAVCCAEKLSIDKRLDEIRSDLDRAPYKLGLLVVTVDSDAQAAAIQGDLERRIRSMGEPRLTIALSRAPLTAEMRTQWLKAITKVEMANDSGHTADANNRSMEARQVVANWVTSAVQGGKMIAWNSEQVMNNLYGMANLRKTMQNAVLEAQFPYAPEVLVPTATAYKAANEPSAVSGLRQTPSNSQMNNVFINLKQAGVEGITDLAILAAADGSKGARAIAAVAKLVKDRAESGQRIVLNDLWMTLQRQPYGYYDCIACGVLLGYVFSSFVGGSFTWTDYQQANFNPTEGALAKMLLTMMKGNMTTDYFSSGSIIWQKFMPYMKKLFNISKDEANVETEGVHITRERITTVGAPYWAMKMLSAETFGSVEYKETADKIVDNILEFIAQDGNRESAMGNVIQLFNSRGKVLERMAKAFSDKAEMATAFRAYLFMVSPELENITTKLGVHSEDLRDKVFSTMQGAVYTWTEDQVKEKLPSIVSEYTYLDTLNTALHNTYHSTEEAAKDLRNTFKYLRISLLAIETLKKPWYEAMQILFRVSHEGIAQMTPEQRTAEIPVLAEYGQAAWECLKDSKPVLADLLSARQLDATSEELNTIYNGLSGLSCELSLTQFNKELDTQTSRISQARNRILLSEKWRSLSGTATIKEWCANTGIPLQWVLPKEMLDAVRVLLAVQRNERTIDTNVIRAISPLNQIDATLLNDQTKQEEAFLRIVGSEYRELYLSQRSFITAQLKMKLGSDMSTWEISDLATVQQLLKRMMQEKAKHEKLADTLQTVKTMQDALLRDKVVAFLNENHSTVMRSTLKGRLTIKSQAPK